MRNDKRELTKSEDLFSWDVKDNLATLKKNKTKNKTKQKKNKKVFFGGRHKTDSISYNFLLSNIRFELIYL